MNIVNFNQPFEAPVGSEQPPKELQRWCASPLFHHAIEIERAAQRWIEVAQGNDWPPAMPFKMMRAALNIHYAASGGDAEWSEVHFFARTLESGAWEIFVYPRDFIRLITNSTQGKHNGLMAKVTTVPGTTQIDMMAFDCKNKKWVQPWLDDKMRFATFNGTGQAEHPTTSKKEALQAMRDQCGQYLMIFAEFCKDAMAPTNHMATVAPNQPGRSVVWLQARTHYTIITHDHPANKASVVHGTRVTDDAAGELQRLAHSRRAHYRTYKHNRYKYVRGQTKLIHACWVGPKEWQDEGGKQIYKILEPVEAAA